MKFGKIAAVGLSVVLATTMLAACGKKSGGSYVPKELKVQFVPSQNAETLEAKAKPLESLLSKQLGIPVKVSVSTDYNTVIEAMASKQVDIGFLPPSNYVVAHDTRKAADLLLQAQRFGVNDADGSATTELVDFYKAMIVVKADSPIKTIEDLKGKKVGWQGVTSAAGYVYPGALLKSKGIDPQTGVQPTQFQGHDKAIIALLNGQVDAVGVFQDIRANMIKDYPNIFKETRVLAFTDKIPNDTIAVRNDMSEEWRKKIQDAFIAIGKDPQGQQVIFDVYSHKGYVVSDDKKFDIVRDVNKQMGLK